ncbi:MAG: serpin family protein [Planctomycetota bacterium]|nr:serpin family protein [Planctomycetota bacterium]
MFKWMLPAAAVAALAMGCALTGNSASAEDDARGKKSRARELSERNSEFGVDLFKRLHVKGENTFISPTSIAMCLQMVAQASKGDTNAEFRKTMHLGEIDLDLANADLLERLKDRDGAKLRVANALWSDPARVTLNQEYVDEMAKYFEAEVRASDFDAPATLDEVNGWISDKTEKKIPRMLERIEKDDVTFLINAIYFKGAWSYQFDKEDTKEADFHLADGSTTKVQMMRRSDEIPYAELPGLQLVKLPYGGDKKIAMWVALPAADSSLEKLIAGMDKGSLKRWQDAAHAREGTLKLPRIKMKFKKNLNDDLKALGIKLAFDSGSADLSRLGSSVMGRLYLGFVLHEAVVEVNEEGTEAAAATIAGIKAESIGPEPFSMVCDRPFLFWISDENTGATLFMGAVYKPGE